MWRSLPLRFGPYYSSAPLFLQRPQVQQYRLPHCKLGTEARQYPEESSVPKGKEKSTQEAQA